MASAAIAYRNLADDALLTVSSQELSLPALNLQNAHVARRWRTLFASGNVTFDLGALVSLDTIGVFGMTMSSAGTIRARVSSVDPTGAAGDLYDSGVVAVDSDYNVHLSLLTVPVSGRYVRFDLADSGSYVEAGRVFVGLRTSFGINFDYGWQRAYVDRSIRTKTRGGQTLVWHDNNYRTLDLTFGFLSVAERNGLVETIDRVNGQNTDVLFITDPESSNLARDSIWGLISNLSPVVQPMFDRFSKQYQIEERL
jgi:hypothetical protein